MDIGGRLYPRPCPALLLAAGRLTPRATNVAIAIRQLEAGTVLELGRRPPPRLRQTSLEGPSLCRGAQSPPASRCLVVLPFGMRWAPSRRRLSRNSSILDALVSADGVYPCLSNPTCRTTVAVVLDEVRFQPHRRARSWAAPPHPRLSAPGKTRRGTRNFIVIPARRRQPPQFCPASWRRDSSRWRALAPSPRRQCRGCPQRGRRPG